MREIPSLQVLCLRSIGPSSCSAESTFASSNGRTGADATENGTTTDIQKSPTKQSEPSLASRLLRSFHDNAIVGRSVCIGTGSARRLNANDVDMFHPLGAEPMEHTTVLQPILLARHGNPACDCLQSVIDSLVELGRMDDQRLGLHFFEEWKHNVVLAAMPSTTERAQKKRKVEGLSSIPLGSLSLYNCNVAQETFESMRDAKIGQHLATLDLSGIRGLTNELLEMLLPDCPNLQELALKNCRRITNIDVVGTHQKNLTTLDIGGSFNISTNHIISIIPQLPRLTRLHASGLGWNNISVGELVECRSHWVHLSLSFSIALTNAALRNNIVPLAHSLTCLALAFCEGIVDNSAMGLLGRNLPLVRALDVRGNPALTTLTGWYDGRVSADLPAQPLTVLGRYSGLSEASVEETKRVHPGETMELVVLLDAGGMGAAIYAESHRDNDEYD